MKILITGASGFIGSHMADHAVREGHDTWVAVRPTSDRSNLQSPSLRHIILNLDDAEQLSTQLEAHRALHGTWDVVIHCAGATKCRHAQEFARYSPIIEPTQAIPTLILSVLIRVGRLPGITSFISICNFVAPIERNSNILSLSVAKKPLSKVIIATIIEIKVAIKIIALLPLPHQTIMIGPKAILGRLLSTTI